MKAKLNESTRVQCAIYEPRITAIQRIVSEYYGLTLQQTQEHCRKGSSIKARRRIHFLCREFLPKCPLAIIGLLTGNGRAFDHATICHASTALHREMTLKSRCGKLVYPEVAEEMLVLRLRVASAFLEQKEPVGVCEHCGQLIN